MRAYPQAQPTVPQGLAQIMIAAQQANRVQRQQFGRAISPDVIDRALRMAYRGQMQPLTDISRETVDTDPHLGSVLNKRFGAVSSLPWEVIPASGPSIDPDRARYYAEVAREQLKSIRGFRRVLLQLAWALYDGRAAQEIQWVETPDSMRSPYGSVNLSVVGCNWIHPRRLSFGPFRELRVMDEMMMYGGDFVRAGIELAKVPYKFIVWLPQLFGEYPEREGLAPRCLYWSFFKRYGARERMILMELFGKPWRIATIDEDFNGSDDDLDSLDASLDALGASYTARLPRGVDVKVVQPGKTAGAVHEDVIKTSDDQISKLVLGQTATTDAAPAGMNNSTANVAQDEQLMILTRDAGELSERIEECLTDAIIAVNFGAEAVSHAPHFKLRSDLPVDRTKELGRVQAALTAGLSLARSEVYEVSGFRQPNDDEPQIRMEQPPTPPNSPVAPAVRPVVVYPAGNAPEPGELSVTPQTASGTMNGQAMVGVVDSGFTIKVNEDRAARGLPPLGLPDGSPDPDGELTVSEFAAKKKAAIDAAIAAAAAPAPALPNPNPATPALPPPAEPAPGIVLNRITASVPVSTNCEPYEHQAAIAVDAILAHVIDDDVLSGLGVSVMRAAMIKDGLAMCAAHAGEQPTTRHGSPDELAKKASLEVRPLVRAMADAFMAAVVNHDTADGIYAALKSAHAKMDLRPLAAVLDRRMVQCAALGALDAADETGFGDKPTKKVKAAAGAAGTPFAELPFADALKVFREKDIVPKHEFDRLSAKIKQRAFTVSGDLGRDALATIHDELVKQVAKGADLREFGTAIEQRLGAAGFLPTTQVLGNGQTVLSATHVETVFRTNTMGALNAGRAKQMTQPAVLKARPVWELRGVDDDHTRDAHKAAHGKCLLATDPFWKTCYPPMWYCCRCRVIARPATYLDKVVPGSSLVGLPEPGWTSGVESMLDLAA